MLDDNVKVFCENNNKQKYYPIGTSLKEILYDQQIEGSTRYLVALVNNEPKELNFKVYKPKKVRFVNYSHTAGHRAYVHSMAFVLYKAVNEIFPGATLRIEHPVSNGYFCKIKRLENGLTPEIIEKIKIRMNEIVKADLPFIRHEEPTEDVIATFEKHNLPDKVKLFQSLGKVFSTYYTLGSSVNHFYGSLVPSTGYLQRFDLIQFAHGVLLRLPSRQDPETLEPIVAQPKLLDIFTEFAGWNEILGLRNISDLNTACNNGSICNPIQVGESLHEKKVALIADQIKAREDEIKIVLISGPSSSGKTTFSKRLMLQLLVNGIIPVALSLDNYFVDREKTPLDENGEYDFESLYALDLELFNQQLNELLAGKEVNLPEFSFTEGKKKFNGNKLKLQPHNVLIIEGIHALNNLLTPAIADNAKYRIYVSALTTISIDNHNWIPTSDNRLLRRIVRDYKFRGYTAQQTIGRWESVRKGENQWIYPFQENADIMFNSALFFELPVLKKHAEPILLQVRQDCPEYAEARRLLQFLSYFPVLHETDIPPTSLLREFLGGSSFNY